MVFEGQSKLQELRPLKTSEIAEWREFKEVEKRSVGFNRFIIESLVRNPVKRA
jgi:hypothetical protein